MGGSDDEEVAQLSDDPADQPAPEDKPSEEPGSDAGGEGEEEPSAEDTEGGSQDSSEEDEEGPDEYEQDDFLVGEGDEEEEGGEEGGEEGKRRKRRKRKGPRDYTLDDEDYDLLEDNQVVVKRPAERTKRLKRLGGEEAGQNLRGVQELKEQLFGAADLEDDMEDEEAGGAAGGSGRGAREPERARPAPRGGDYYDELSDEMDDFIDDGDNEEARARRRARARGGDGGFVSEAMAEAARIFGDATDLHDLVASRKAIAEPASDDPAALAAADEEDEEALAAELGDDYDAGAVAELRERRAAAARERQQQRLLEAADPEYVAAHYLSAEDEAIRATDRPERLQLAMRKNLATLQGMDEATFDTFIKNMARWVYDNLFSDSAPDRMVRQVVETGRLEVCGKYKDEITGVEEDVWPGRLIKGVPSHRESIDLRNNKGVRVRRGKQERDRWRANPDSQQGLRNSLEAVLRRMFAKWEEVPVIAMFRKEECGELLALRSQDEPHYTGRDEGMTNPRFPDGTIQPKHRRIRRWDVLWAVQAWGLRYLDMYDTMQKRGKVYSDAFDRAAAAESGVDAEVADALAQCGTGVMNAESNFAVADWHAKFSLMQGAAPQIALAALSLDDPSAANGAAAAAAAAGKRRPQRGARGAYPQLRAAGVGGVARRVALGPLEFAENLDEDANINEPDDLDLAPSDYFAREAADPTFVRNPALAAGEALMRATQSFLAEELAAEPAVRAVVRSIYQKHALVSTEPTEAGESELDPFHRFGSVKRLHDKPIASFEGSDTFLRIAAAVKAGYITCSITLDSHRRRVDLEDRLVKLYSNSYTSDLAKIWNNWRGAILLAAISEKLLPAVERETVRWLEAEARDVVLSEASDAMWEVVKRPPLRLQAVEDDDAAARDEEEPPVVAAPRIMAVVWGPGGGYGGRGESAPAEPTTVVQLDGAGNLVDLLTCPQLSGRIPRTIELRDKPGATYDPADDPKKAKDSVRIRDKILEHYPNAVVVGASSPHAKQLMDDLTKISQHTERKFQREIRDNLENQRVEVLWGEEAVAALWAVSAAARAEFPEHTALVRRAVALGRMALDPLAVISSLCGRGGEALSLQLHALQDRVPPEDLMATVEKVMVTAVSQCGFDINAAAAHPWRQPALQFVPGLGPRKAGALMKGLARSGNILESRVELREAPGEEGAGEGVRLLGTKVFANAAPFIRVRAGEVTALANYEFEQLDDSRIHPERELWLHTLHETLDEDGTGYEPARLFEAKNNMLSRIDLMDFAIANDIADRMHTVLDIFAELLAPYGEVRLDGAPLEEGDVFYSLHGETPESFKLGQLVEARVRYVDTSRGAFAKLDILPNEIEGLLEVKNAEPGCNDLRDLQRAGRLQLGSTVRARVASIGYAEDGNTAQRRFVVGLTTLPEDLENDDRWEKVYCLGEHHAADGTIMLREPCYILSSTVNKAKASRKGERPGSATTSGGSGGGKPTVPLEARKKLLARRPIEHPLWKHELWSEAVERLSALPDGSATFRPTQGPERFLKVNLTIRAATLASGPLWLHLSLLEDPKKPRNRAALSPPLRIDGRAFGPAAAQASAEEYEDLDEVVARFVEPLTSRYKEVTRSRKFKDGDRASVDAAIDAELQASGGRAAAYCISLDADRPLSGRLTFRMPNGRSCHHEPFVLLPTGVFFRSKLVPSVEHMLSFFKKDPNYLARRSQQAGLEAQRAQQAAPPPPGMGGGGPPPGMYGGYGGGYGGPPLPPGPGGFGGGPPPGPGGYLPAPPAAAAAGGGGGGYSRGPPGPPGGGGGYGGPPQFGGPPMGGPGGYQPAGLPPGPPPPMGGPGGYNAGGFGGPPPPLPPQGQPPYPPRQQQPAYGGGGGGGGGYSRY